MKGLKNPFRRAVVVVPKRCIICESLSTNTRYASWMDRPGGGWSGEVCENCEVPQDWHARIGIARCSGYGKAGHRYEGTPRLVVNEVLTARESHQSQPNAFGSILYAYECGCVLPFICMHGGSEWLCPRCAIAAANQPASERTETTPTPAVTPNHHPSVPGLEEQQQA